MNRFIAVAALFVVALGMFATTNASAAVITYTTFMDGPSEPNASLGTGNATVTYDDSLHTMRVQASFSGLTGDSTAAHIHAATAAPFTGTAGVATRTPTFAGLPTGVKAGSWDETYDLTLNTSWNPSYITANGGTPATAETAFFNAMNANKAYFQIHSSAFPGGEIRGFMVPEPGALTLLGVVGLGAAIRRRRAG